MEVAPHNISVTLSLPPDTDTPGFAVEQLNKPLETKLICAGPGLVAPEVVAEQLIKDALVSGLPLSQFFTWILVKINPGLSS